MAKQATNDISVPRKWAQYSASKLSFGQPLSLVDASGKCPRKIVMLEAGGLYCRDFEGTPAYLTGLWQGYEHQGQVSQIDAQQSAAFIAYW